METMVTPLLPLVLNCSSHSHAVCRTSHTLLSYTIYFAVLYIFYEWFPWKSLPLLYLFKGQCKRKEESLKSWRSDAALFLYQHQKNVTTAVLHNHIIAPIGTQWWGALRLGAYRSARLTDWLPTYGMNACLEVLTRRRCKNSILSIESYYESSVIEGCVLFTSQLETILNCGTQLHGCDIVWFTQIINSQEKLLCEKIRIH